MTTATFDASTFDLAVTVLGSVRRSLYKSDVTEVLDFVELDDKVKFAEFVNTFGYLPHPDYAPRRNGQYNGRLFADVSWSADNGHQLFVGRTPSVRLPNSY